MTKMELINDILVDMSLEMCREQLERLKTVLIVKMQGYELDEVETLPSAIVYDNEWILKRYTIDLLAKGLEQSTIRNYICILKKFFRETSKNYREIAGQDIVDYLALYQYSKKISHNYKGTLCRYLTAFFGWAYRKHHIDADIITDVDSIKVVRKKKDRLTDMEIEDIREACLTLKEKAIFELMLSTGLRVSEIAGLNVSDIDFNTGVVNVYGEKSNAYRTAFLNTKAVKALKAYVGSKECQGDVLFTCTRKPHNRLGKGSIEKIAKLLGERAGVHLTTTVHVYRKTFASIMYLKTKDVLFVSKLLGHANTQVTIECYLCDDLEDMRLRHKNVA